MAPMTLGDVRLVCIIVYSALMLHFVVYVLQDITFLPPWIINVLNKE